MLFVNRPANWENRDYRVYCDQRSRRKRRLRLRMSIGVALALLVGMVLVTAWVNTKDGQPHVDADREIASQAGLASGPERLRNTP